MHFTNQPKRRDLVDTLIACDNDVWRIINVGVTDADGFIHLHLASTTRFRQQRNGKSPVQSCQWLHPDMIAACACLAREAA